MAWLRASLRVPASVFVASINRKVVDMLDCQERAQALLSSVLFFLPVVALGALGPQLSPFKVFLKDSRYQASASLLTQQVPVHDAGFK